MLRDVADYDGVFGWLFGCFKVEHILFSKKGENNGTRIVLMHADSNYSDRNYPWKSARSASSVFYFVGYLSSELARTGTKSCCRGSF
ncbi:MAG: hypothetical protein OIN87_00525 [Candidatus Methanoperedens sp.]|nr:hypothetical protein [Candidatus Methanoperedens sp.]